MHALLYMLGKYAYRTICWKPALRGVACPHKHWVEIKANFTESLCGLQWTHTTPHLLAKAERCGTTTQKALGAGRHLLQLSALKPRTNFLFLHVAYVKCVGVWPCCLQLPAAMVIARLELLLLNA